VLNCLVEFGLVSCDNADIGTLLCQLGRESFTHATRASGDQDRLDSLVSACVHQPEWLRQTHPALDGEMLVGREQAHYRTCDQDGNQTDEQRIAQ
jgi:hypothetical protein